MFTVELGYVRRIEKAESFGAVVTLADDRSLELYETNDVDLDNKGIMIAREGADPENAASWRIVSWDDFREVRLWSSR